jgi:hypothetical protein
VRGLLASGYPLFPSAAFDLGLPWRVAEEDARSLYEHAHRFARRSGQAWDEGRLGWLRPWLSTEALDNRRFLAPLALSIALSIAAALRRAAPAAPLLAAWLGLLLWFLVMPDTRFAGPLLWLPGAVALGLHAARGSGGPAERLAWALVALACAGGAFPGPPAPPWRDALPPARHDGPATPSFTLVTGERVREGQSCFDPPCAWKHVEGLGLRRPGDFASGFFLAPDAAPTAGTPPPAP